jgi:hypothetical protein
MTKLNTQALEAAFEAGDKAYMESMGDAVHDAIEFGCAAYLSALSVTEEGRSETTTPDDDGWIAWTDNRPRPGSEAIEARLRSGRTIIGLPSLFDWRTFDEEGDIVAYRRVVKP